MDVIGTKQKLKVKVDNIVTVNDVLQALNKNTGLSIIAKYLPEFDKHGYVTITLNKPLNENQKLQLKKIPNIKWELIN
jgi:hypothetical protein